MARKNKQGKYSYNRTALVRGLEAKGRFAVIQKDREQTRVVERLADGSAPEPGILVATDDVFDLKPTYVVHTGQRGTITLPEGLRRDLGVEEGTPLEFIQEDDERVSIRLLRHLPSEHPAADLNELLSRVTAENLHGETPTGDAVGGEAW